MELILESKGSKLSKDGKIFVVKNYNGEKTKITTVDLERIIISQGIQITSDAIIFAMSKGIDIFIIDKYNQILGKVTNNTFGSNNKIRRNQYYYFSNLIGTQVGKELLVKKIDGLIKILDSKNLDSKKMYEYRDKILKVEGKPDDIRNIIMGYEGNMTRYFYEKTNEILPLKYRFLKREHRDAKEVFNVILNYIYGIMYRICENELIKVGIDPYIGIFHTDDYSKKSFLYDFIEAFRPYGIECAIDFINKKYIREAYISDGVISLEGRRVLIEYTKSKLKKQEMFNNKKYERGYLIKVEAQRIASLLKEDL